MTPLSHYLTCEGREIHVTEWGAGHAETVIAWHGLARTGRDMDVIAAQLARRWRVLCPDTLGRGLSQWSPAPAQEYCLAFYERLAVSLVNQMGVQQMHWLGTSMGGAIGLRAAAGALRGRIQRLLLNDIGPELAAAALQRIRSYAGSPPAFATVAELEGYFRTVYKPYGWLSDAQWRLLTETSLRRLDDGRVAPHYDPSMVMQFEAHPQDYDQWPAWDSLSLPVLCLRGEHSDLLPPEVAEAMRVRGPCAVVVTIAGCGHAPALNTPEQIAVVERFLAG
jgi:pimeloyl-ACP methyl ester carboxylesterase